MPAFSEAGRGRGFVLVVVLWLLVALAVGAGLIVLWSRERVVEAQALAQRVSDRVAMVSTRDTLLYLAARVPMTQGGLPLAPIPDGELARRRLDDFGGFDKSPRGGELTLDDRPYLGLEGVVFRLQDEAGLVPIAQPVNAPLAAWLQAAGVPRRAHPALIDALGDYADPDDLRRLRGAEGRQYERAGLPPPANRPLLSPSELPSVLGFHAISPGILSVLEDSSTTLESTALNLNAAPVPLLLALVDRCDRRCLAAIAQRRVRPFLSGTDFEARTGARLPGDRDVDFRSAPSGAFRVTLQGRSGSAHRLHVRLTPLADREAPWRVDAVDLVPRPVADEPPTPIESPLFAPATLAGP